VGEVFSNGGIEQRFPGWLVGIVPGEAPYTERRCAMSDIHVLPGRSEIPDKPGSGGIRFFVQYLLSPLLVIVIGAIFYYELEEAKLSFQRLELEVKRIEATRGFMTELFSGSPQRAFVAERLIQQIVDDKLAAEVSSIVKDYHAERIEIGRASCRERV